MTEGTSIVNEGHNADIENLLFNFNFAIVDDKIMWVNFDQKKVWELEISQI